jgi:hypothetical protein
MTLFDARFSGALAVESLMLLPRGTRFREFACAGQCEIGDWHVQNRDVAREVVENPEEIQSYTALRRIRDIPSCADCR